MKVSYLGGRAENYAEWNKVYSEKGGMYEMTIQYVPHADRKLEIKVNNEKSILLKDLAGTDGQQLASITVQVRLKPGNNVVLWEALIAGHPISTCFTLKKIE